MPADIINISLAENYLSYGLSVLPAIAQRKSPPIKWGEYQKRLPTDSEISQWFSSAQQDALCVVCGAVSGNLEIIDFDQAGAGFMPWQSEVLKSPEFDILPKVVIEKTPSGGFHVIYRCELPVSESLKLAKTPEGKTLIETRGEKGLFLCAPSPGYQLIQGRMDSIPRLSAVERNILLQSAKDLNQYREKESVPLPFITPTPAHAPALPSDCSNRPGDIYRREGDVRELLVKHGWTFFGCDEGEERWTRPGKKTGTSATLRQTENGLYFYVFSSNAEPLVSGRAYDPFGLFAALEAGDNFEKASEMLAVAGFGNMPQRLAPPVSIDWDTFTVNGVKPEIIAEKAKKEQKADKNELNFKNRRDPDSFTPFPLDCLGTYAQNYVREKSQSLLQDPAGIAMTLLTQCGAHIGAAVKLRLGKDRFTAPILWMAYIGLSGSGKSPAINGVAKLADDISDEIYDRYAEKQKEYLAKNKIYEKNQKSKNPQPMDPPEAPTYRKVIVTDATYEGLVRAVKDSGGRTLLKIDELTSWFAMTNRTKTPGEAQRWLSGYSGESVETARTTSLEIRIRDAYWSILGGTTPEKFKSMIGAEGRDNDGTLSRFCLVWPPEVTSYAYSDVEGNTLNLMKKTVENLITFAPEKPDVLILSESARNRWYEWIESVFYEKQKLTTDIETSFIAKSQDLLPRIAIILHCLDAAERMTTQCADGYAGCVVEWTGTYTQSQPVDPVLTIPHEIPLDVWERAEKITEWVRKETIACYSQLNFISENAESKNQNEKESAVLELLQTAGEEGLTAREIVRKKNFFRNKQDLLQSILDKLIQDNKVKKCNQKIKNGNTCVLYSII